MSNQKTIPAYSFDAKTGVYMTETEADLSPLEADVYIVPRHATLIAPPADMPAGSAAFWREDQWKIEKVPLVDDNLDGIQDAPEGFKTDAAKPGYFARLAKAIIGKA